MNLQGKKILIIGGAFQHCKLVEVAHELGIIVYVVDYLPVEQAPAKQISDYHYEYNISDYDKIVELCKKEQIDGVLSAYLDACQLPYQEICERMGYPCFGSKEQFRILTDKTAFIKTCIENGVDVIPQYTEDEFLSFNPEIEYPIFVKPCDSRGSRGQTICYSFEEVEKAIQFAKQESKTGKVIIEKYMGGKQEFTISYLIDNENSILLRSGDRYVGAKEDGMDKSAILSISPSKYLDFYKEYEEKKVISMLKKIGIKSAPIFMQGFIDNNKVRFFDPGLRFPGCEYDRMYKHCTQIDICKLLINFALNGKFQSDNYKIDKDAMLNGKQTAMLFIVIKPGKINKISGFDEIKKHPSIISISQKYHVGDIVGEYYNVNQRFCEIDIVCDSIQDMQKMIDWIYSTLIIKDEQGVDMKMSMFDTKLLNDRR